jgi:hypothetical protein
MMDDWIPLALVPTALKALTGVQPPKYRTLYTAILDGKMPAEQRNGRWYVDRMHLAAIALQFRMVTLEPSGPLATPLDGMH